ncbi:C2H2-type zinc finger protein [Aeropyrum pernix]|nr:C2H2-type zinc finger protein [Aeropyrum pernix]
MEEFECKECGVKFATKEEFEKHIKEHHSHEHHHHHHH